ncbi:DUF4189 domain-containing protein [Mycobacterium intracellulare]|uniref:DUF4189 domain-containing protein n=1 Tax=Mycobacterium intracellulare TaxID=1767 RepID=UPI0006CA9F17|nr:DUF4189 domain-containing protein [Mycobacterium intracellulare]KPN45923.1 hypothetical protein AN933_26905 [Mycobacterium intracellulare subsp. chimaera]
MTTQRRHRIAFAAACVGATEGIMGMVFPLSPQADAHIDSAVVPEMGIAPEAPEAPVVPVIRYGAIAYAPNGSWGRTRDYAFRAQAEQVALEKCGRKDCKLVITFQRCGAVAYDGSTYQGGSGFALSVAENDALERLGGGKIVNWACN